MTKRITPWDKHGKPPGYTVRLICYATKLLNRTNALLQQYTITILPSFIQPYSRFSVPKIIDSFEKYIDQTKPNLIVSALLMGTENVKTFMRYYRRIQDRCQGWITFLVACLSLLDKTISWERKPEDCIETTKNRWMTFLKISHAYCSEIGKLNSDEKLVLYGIFEMQYVLSLLDGNHMGLGP